MIVPGGGISLDGTHWVRCKPDFLLPVRVLSRLFRRLFLGALADAHAAGRLAFFGELEDLRPRKACDAHLAPLKRKKWFVYAKPPFAGPEAVLAYLARYTHRVAIANSRLMALDERGVTFRYKANKATEADRKDFLNLSDAEQNARVGAIRVVPVAGLSNFTLEIESALHYICDPTQLTDLTSELEGWWTQRVSGDLGKGRGAVIPLMELEAHVAYLREKYKRSNLPIDEDDPTEDPETLAGYVFVEQLRVLHVREARIRNAQSDFLRARAQRSKWVREARLDPAEINSYDRSLCDFWRTRFAIMADEITGKTSEDDKRKSGRNLLAWAETQIVSLRGAQAQFLTSGSYHALADEVRIGWHPDYEQKFLIGKK